MEKKVLLILVMLIVAWGKIMGEVDLSIDKLETPSFE